MKIILTALIFASLLLLNVGNTIAQDMAHNSKTKQSLYAIANDDSSDAFIIGMNAPTNNSDLNTNIANEEPKLNTGRKVDTGLGYSPTWDATLDSKTLDAPIITVLDKAGFLSKTKLLAIKKAKGNLLSLECDAKLAQQ